MIFNIYNTSVTYPIFIDSGEISAKFFLVLDEGSVVVTFDADLGLNSATYYSLTSYFSIKSRIENFRYFDSNNSYYILNQSYNANLTDKDSWIVIARTNLNLDLIDWSMIYFGDQGKKILLFYLILNRGGYLCRFYLY